MEYVMIGQEAQREALRNRLAAIEREHLDLSLILEVETASGIEALPDDSRPARLAELEKQAEYLRERIDAVSADISVDNG